MKLFEDLQWRGLVKQYSSDSLIEKLNNGKLTFYIGTDPTADSLHWGGYCIGRGSARNLRKRFSRARENI